MTAPYFLTLAPIDSSLPAQTVAFSPSDHIQLLLGGVHVDYYRRRRPPHHTADFIFDEQRITPDHCDLTLFHQTPYLTNCDNDGTTRVNGQALQREERVVLHHGDRIEIGDLGAYSGNFENTLALSVHFSTSPPASSSHPLPSHSLLSATAGAFDGMRACQNTEWTLRTELTSIKKQLHEALEAAAAHVCVPPPSPRSYGSLLEDLRARDVEDNLLCSESAPLAATSYRESASLTSYSLRPSTSSTLYPHSASVPSASPSVSSTTEILSSSAPAPSPSVSSTESRSVTASPSVVTSALTSVLRSEVVPSSTSPSHSTTIPPSTSVLTSVLGSVPSSASLPASVSSKISPSASSSAPSIAASTSVQSDITLSPTSSVPSSTPATSTSPSPLDADDKRRDVLETTVTGMTSSVDITMIRIRTAWIRAREAVMDGSRDVQHAQVALTRILDAWRTERAAVMASSGSIAPPSIKYLPAIRSWISSLRGCPGTSLSPPVIIFPLP